MLLAAGQGSRFGRPKALVELDGQTLAERGIGMLRAGGADPLLIVTGAAEVELGPEHRIRTIRNDEWRTGMGSSLRAALRALSDPDVGPEVGRKWRAVVALADQPLVGAEAVSPADRRAPGRRQRGGRRLPRQAAQSGAAGPRALA